MSVLALVASIATIIIGMYMPWFDYRIGGLDSAFDANGPTAQIGTILTVIVALAALAPTNSSDDRKLPGTVASVFGIVIVGLACWALIVSVDPQVVELFPQMGISNLRPRPGLFVTMAGGVLMLFAGVGLLGIRTPPPPIPQSADETSVPPGWYPNPDLTQSLRYWTGQSWTSHVMARHRSASNVRFNASG